MVRNPEHQSNKPSKENTTIPDQNIPAGLNQRIL